MAKLHRTSRPPTGALAELRNTRLYGCRDEQIAGASLASRGQPNTDRAYVKPRPRRVLETERDVSAHRAHLQRAQDRMFTAQRATRAAKQHGQPFAHLAAEARDARAAYLKLTGGTERREIVLADASDANKVKAV